MNNVTSNEYVVISFPKLFKIAATEHCCPRRCFPKNLALVGANDEEKIMLQWGVKLSKSVVIFLSIGKSL